MKQRLMALFFICLLVAGVAGAQTTDTDTDTDTAEDDFGSTINWFFVACEDRAVVDLDGFMEAGFDVYVQVFGGTGGTGDPLSSLLRVPVSNDYQVSQTITYAAGETRLVGQFASAFISIASESNPDNEIFSTTVDDTQDGCADPTYPSVDTVDAGTSVTADGRVVIGSSGIYTPDGGVLNEVFQQATPATEPVVVIGARESAEDILQPGRTSDPGLIFAECDAFQGADPGLLFDTDSLTVFWSWFASTPELVRDHIANARYEVFLNSETAGRQSFPNVIVSPVVQREDGNYWVFYTAALGDGFKPGRYAVTYYVEWANPIFDGFEDFGPDTPTPSIYNTCTFDVEPNPFGIQVDQRNPTTPLQS